MLCYTFVRWLFGLSCLKVPVFLTALHTLCCLAYVCVCVVLGMNQFWSEGVTRLEVHWDVMFGEKS